MRPVPVSGYLAFCQNFTIYPKLIYIYAFNFVIFVKFLLKIYSILKL